jgi:2-polyprenyl-3-methyl-5-hydroxy-6-metoxy-1,4-benzoquinol methylase
MSQIHYTSCPSCQSNMIQPALSVLDHTVSKAEFPIWECRYCGLRFTQDAPDAASIGAYYASEDYISHTNTQKGLVNRLYHLIRRQTLADKYRLIASATRAKQGRLLDIGAGTGAFAGYMQGKGWDVTGLEPDEGARKRALTDFGVRLADTSSLFDLPAESFDAITMWHVLEHVHALHPYVEQLKALVRKSGRIFIAVPNYTSYDARVYAAAWAAYDAPRHLYHFSPEAMANLLAIHGLHLQSSQPMWYDSFYISMLSEKYRNGGKGNLPRAVASGVLSNLKAFINKARCSSLVYIISR